MADRKTVRLLLIEDDLEDEHLVREALAEIEEGLAWGAWRSCELTHAAYLADAVDLLDAESYDAILLNLTLPDAVSPLDAFLAVRARAQDAPIVVLADEDDSNLDTRLVREGAQDVLLKRELEHGLLARSIRYAIARHRRVAALASTLFRDELTGVYNRIGFLATAAHYVKLAAHAGQAAALTLIELGEPRSPLNDLAVIRTAELAQRLFHSPTLFGRLACGRLGLVTVGTPEPAIESLLNELRDNAPGLQFQIFPLRADPAASIEEAVVACEGEFSASAGAAPPKPVMLAG